MSTKDYTNFKSKLEIDKLKKDLQDVMDLTEQVVDSVGIGRNNIAEVNPKFNAYDFEIVHAGKHDSNIVLGRDRAGIFGSSTGYGTLGHTSCASIDIVVGRKSSSKNFDIQTEIINPDFMTDAARVYLSQKSDIDDYFALPSGKSGTSIARSGIGMKADCVRIIGRESIKLVVGTDTKNSQGGIINTKGGVELIGGDINEVEKANRIVSIDLIPEEQIKEIEQGGLQPIPLGANLNFALNKMVEKVDKLSGILLAQTTIIISFLKELAAHTHFDAVSEYYGMTGLPSDECLVACSITETQLAQHTITELTVFRENELNSYRNNHLNPGGAYYINSKYHGLN